MDKPRLRPARTARIQQTMVKEATQEVVRNVILHD